MNPQNVAKMVVPSVVHHRHRLPPATLVDQWRGVYYASALSAAARRRMLLGRKRATAAALAAHNSRVASALAAHHRWVANANASARGADALPRLHLATSLLGLGLVSEGSAHAGALTAATASGAPGALSADTVADLIASFAAPQLGEVLAATQGRYDAVEGLKLLGDRQAAERLAAAEAAFSSIADAGHAAGNRAGLSARHYNSLMSVALSCGFAATRRVAGQMYDAMGAAGVAPDARTYALVCHSLGMSGAVAEADSVFAWLRANAAAELTPFHYLTMMRVYRANKMYDACDTLWVELCDRRWPRADAAIADTYLRAIIDLAYTPVSAPLSTYGEVHTAEKKRVPLVLTQMERLGIPRAHLTPPVADEVADALRKFLTYKGRVANWGRAAKLFDFIEFRRANGWLYDVTEMSPITQHAPVMRHPRVESDSSTIVGTAELPTSLTLKETWERPPLEHVLARVERGEHMHDTRQGDKFYEKAVSLHERATSWMLDSPQTRYDQLYGAARPNVPQVGIRRHLAHEYAGREEVMARDASIVRLSLSAGRRARQHIETARTHRNAPDGHGAAKGSRGNQ